MSTRPSTIVSGAPLEVDEVTGEIVIDGGAIRKKILKEGTGPRPTDRADVTVHYTGRLLDGTVFDSSKKRNEPFVFKIGKGQVIKGWDIGVASMKVGEHAILTCCPEYAYGHRGSPPTIPPNATLAFEVELLSFDNTTKVTDDGGVKKAIQKAGSSHNRPNDNATVKIKYTARVKGVDRPFIDHAVEAVKVTLGSDPNFIWGLEEGIKNMYSGERAIIYATPAYGFGSKGDAALGVPADADLEFDVELVDMQKGIESSQLAFDAKLAHMTALKEYGNAIFKLGSLERAITVYTKVVHVFPFEGGLDDEQKAAVNAVKISAISNNALCKLKQQDWDGVIQHAIAGLAIQPQHVKLLYYRSQAYGKLGQAAEAEADLRAAALADPNNKDVARELNAIKARLKAQADKEKKAFGGFFGRVKLVSEAEEAQAAREKAEAEAKKKREEDAENESDESDDEEAPAAEEAPKA